MVKNLISTLFILVLFSVNTVNAQVTVSASHETAPPGGEVVVDISVRNFNAVRGMSFSLNYDPAIITFNAIENIVDESILPEVSNDLFGHVDNSENVEGDITFAYSGQEEVEHTLPDNTVLFSVRFNVLGSAGQVSPITVSGTPTDFEIYNDDLDIYETAVDNGSVTVENAPDPNGIIVSAAEVEVQVGESVCVPFTVQNFDEIIVVGTGTVFFDDNILNFIGIENIHPDLVAEKFKNSNFFAQEGQVRFSWTSDNSDPQPFNIPDGATIFEMCFTAEGNAGDMSIIELSEQAGNGLLPFSWINEEAHSSSVENGKVTIVEGVPTDVTFVVESKTVIKGNTECIGVSVRNYDDIVTSQFGIKYDGSVLSFIEGRGTGAIPEISGSSFNNDAANNEIGYILPLNEGVTIADDVVIFELCFDVIGDCESQSKITIGSFNGPELEVSQGSEDNVVDVYTIEGTVDVVCLPNCSLVRTDPSCIGATDGNIIVTIESGCDCLWKDSNGTEISSNCNLLNVGPGDYTLTVTCPGDQPGCTLDATVDALASIGVTGVVTDIGCDGSKGSIKLSTSSTGNYTFEWIPILTGGSEVTGLDKGTYTVTVTDEDSGCIETATFEIKESEPIVITEVDITDSDGNNGSISIQVTGGTPPLNYNWTGASSLPNASTIDGLAPGNYSVTITDDYGCSITSEVYPVGNSNDGFSINNVQVVKVSGNNGIECYGDQNATITANLVKGNLPVNVSVSGDAIKTITVNEIGEFSIDNLGAGTYTITAEDASGEVITLPAVTVLGPDQITITIVDNSYNCADGNLCDGAVEIEVDGGIPSYIYEWSDNSITGTSADGLCAGAYNVIVTDANNCQVMQNILIRDCNDNSNCYEGNKFITPNNDGNNDYLSISCIENVVTNLSVYNRWGEEVYRDNNYQNDWAGTDTDGSTLLEGVYMWVLEAEFGNDTRVVKGTVTILRNK